MRTSLTFTKITRAFAVLGAFVGLGLMLLGAFLMGDAVSQPRFVGEPDILASIVLAMGLLALGVVVLASSAMIGVLTDISISVAKPAPPAPEPGSEDETDPAFKYIKKR